jgi:phosphopantothenoylcysteine synthetase/decarboxylase
MRILITAGNTQAPIDRVRCITNIFTGRTGAAIAVRSRGRGHAVTLLTSHPETITDSPDAPTVRTYRTFQDLHDLMAECVRGGAYDAVVHCAAVSDYLMAGVFGSEAGTQFDAAAGRWSVRTTPDLRTTGKIKSDAPELWLRLERAPKLIDMVRRDWGFRGVLVKFKLEVGVTDEQLLDVAERSRRQSDADLMVANTLESAAEYAFVGPVDGRYSHVPRSDLADRLLDAIGGVRKGS